MRSERISSLKDITRKSEEGQGTVEFALVFPVLMLFVIFIIDCGWILYQRAAFDYGYSHAGWAIRAEDLRDPGGYEENGVYTQNLVEVSADAVGTSIRQGIGEAALSGFLPENLAVENAEARMGNSEPEPVKIPDHKGDEALSFIVTRRLYLSADLTYRIRVLTPIGQMIFGKETEAKKHLDYERIVGKQVRTK